MKILKLLTALLLTLALFGCQTGKLQEVKKQAEENQSQAQTYAQQFSGNYQMTYDLSQIEIALGGAVHQVSMAELEGGATIGTHDLPPEIAAQLREKLPQTVNFTLSETVKIGIQELQFKNLSKPDAEQQKGLFTLKNQKFIFGKLGEVERQGSCGSLGGVFMGGQFTESQVSGSTTVGFIGGCSALLVGGRATIKWSGSK